MANDFVRVYNSVPPRTRTTPGNCVGQRRCPPTSVGTPVTVYAAILAVNHSFIVDNYDCGIEPGQPDHLGGDRAALPRAGRYCSAGHPTGYNKNYNYNDRLPTTEPPYFLNPDSTAWYISRETECNGTTC